MCPCEVLFIQLSSDWLRVGYTQSNFNADNCLLSGLTLDYGPFGFIEKYQPGWGMWIGAGEHYSFLNQPEARSMSCARPRCSLMMLERPTRRLRGGTSCSLLGDCFP